MKMYCPHLLNLESVMRWPLLWIGAIQIKIDWLNILCNLHALPPKSWNLLIYFNVYPLITLSLCYLPKIVDIREDWPLCCLFVFSEQQKDWAHFLINTLKKWYRVVCLLPENHLVSKCRPCYLNALHHYCCNILTYFGILLKKDKIFVLSPKWRKFS